MADKWFNDKLSRENLHSYTKRHLISRRPRIFDWLDGLSVTGWLILVNVIFFIIEMSLLFIFGQEILYYLALQPLAFMTQGYVWTLLTSMFMHAPGIFSAHLLVNMFVLFSLGSLSERIIGRKRFFWFYMIAGLFAGLLHVVLTYLFRGSELGIRIFGSPFLPALGASGAIFAIAGLFVVLTPRLKFMIIFLPFFSLPAYIMIPLVLFLTWIITSSVGFPMGNVAHFGGFLVGLIYGFYLRNKYPKKTKMLSRMFSS